ncbi:MAG: glycosyltransferase family 4 protein [Planctomycetaceae bacterium]
MTTATSPLILLLADTFALRGTSSYTLRLAEQLPQQGFRTQIVCPCARMVKLDRRDELPLREYPHLLTPLWGQVVRRWMLADVCEDPPALIHIQSRRMLPLGTWLAKRLGCSFVLTVHDFLQPSERLPFLSTWGLHIMTVSDAVRAELLQRTKLRPELVSVIPSGVDVPSEPPRAVLEPHRTPVIGTAGPLEAVKGFPFFLGAAQRVAAADVPAEFLVAGAGPEEANLRRLARELDIADRVTFVPNLLDLNASLSAMDIFCLPSLRQGLGTLMLEAMALGRPVIASDVDGVDSVVHDNETGLLVPPSNSEALAQRMLELLRDPFRARRLAEAAREMVRRDFSVARMAQQTAGVYRRVLGLPAPETASSADRR